MSLCRQISPPSEYGRGTNETIKGILPTPTPYPTPPPPPGQSPYQALAPPLIQLWGEDLGPQRLARPKAPYCGDQETRREIIFPPICPQLMAPCYPEDNPFPPRHFRIPFRIGHSSWHCSQTCHPASSEHPEGLRKAGISRQTKRAIERVGGPLPMHLLSVAVPPSSTP